MAVSLTIYEIFSVEVLHDLENWVRGWRRLIYHIRLYKNGSAIVNIALSGTVFELFDVE